MSNAPARNSTSDVDPPAPTVLEIDDLHVDIDSSRGLVQPVRGISLAIESGQTLGLVGESGSGKSVTAMSITGLLPRTSVRITRGRVMFEGNDLAAMPERRLRALRGKRIGTIFQEPMTALDPAFTIGNQIAEPLRLHLGLRRKQLRDHGEHLLGMVGIHDPRAMLRSYPHELSGGMRQRVMIAMAMSCEPALLIADEPTTALDVTTQSQILDLMLDLQAEHGTAILMITHDLGVVAQTCQQVAVMRAGEIVEYAPATELFAAPKHPYTRHLLDSLPGQSYSSHHSESKSITESAAERGETQ